MRADDASVELGRGDVAAEGRTDLDDRRRVVRIRKDNGTAGKNGAKDVCDIALPLDLAGLKKKRYVADIRLRRAGKRPKQKLAALFVVDHAFQKRDGGARFSEQEKFMDDKIGTLPL